MSKPKNIGFVSLGCPKALVDSERILTQLRTDGYEIAPDYASADLVVVNTCGFIDAAKAESLEAIGEALEENGRVIVTGCLGAHADDVLGACIAAAEDIAAMGPVAIRLCKRAIHENADSDLASAQAAERTLFGLCFSTSDQKEGMAAFLGKRAAEFTGK